MAAIVLIRSDIPAGVLQVTDLWPNASQRNQIYDPQPQGPAYLSHSVDNMTETVALAGGTTTTAEFKGLAAYLLDTIENNDGAGAEPGLTAAQANDIANQIILDVKAGAAMTVDAVNAIVLAEVGTASGIGLGDSIATLNDIQQILAGAEYVLPSGSVITAAGEFVAVARGSFNTTGLFREVYATNSLIISAKAGILKTLSSSSFSYKGTTGAAVVVYDDAGNVLA